MKKLALLGAAVTLAVALSACSKGSDQGQAASNSQQGTNMKHSEMVKEHLSSDKLPAGLKEADFLKARK